MSYFSLAYTDVVLQLLHLSQLISSRFWYYLLQCATLYNWKNYTQWHFSHHTAGKSHHPSTVMLPCMQYLKCGVRIYTSHIILTAAEDPSNHGSWFYNCTQFASSVTISNLGHCINKFTNVWHSQTVPSRVLYTYCTCMASLSLHRAHTTANCFLSLASDKTVGTPSFTCVPTRLSCLPSWKFSSWGIFLLLLSSFSPKEVFISLRRLITTWKQ